MQKARKGSTGGRMMSWSMECRGNLVEPFCGSSLNLEVCATLRLRACVENRSRRAQAVRLCRPATRRTEGPRLVQPGRSAFSWRCSLPFRSASRRPGRASRPHHPFFDHALRNVRARTPRVIPGAAKPSRLVPITVCPPGREQPGRRHPFRSSRPNRGDIGRCLSGDSAVAGRS